MTSRYLHPSNAVGHTTMSTPSSLKRKRRILPIKNYFGTSRGGGDAIPGTSKSTSSRVTEKESKPIKKSVSFQESVSCRHTIPLNEYTKEEIDACWISKEESKAINADIKLTVDLLTNGNLDQEDDTEEEHCRRGLEYQTPKGELRRNRLQMATREVVLNEQDMQYEQYGYVVEPFLVAAACQLISKSAIDDARSIALQDELDARMIMLL